MVGGRPCELWRYHRIALAHPLFWNMRLSEHRLRHGGQQMSAIVVLALVSLGTI